MTIQTSTYTTQSLSETFERLLAEEVTYANKKIKSCHSAVRGLKRRGAAGIGWAMQNVNLAKQAAADIETSLDRLADALPEELVESATHTALVARAAAAELHREVKNAMHRAETAA